jgi:hypothetical protein
LGQDAKTKDVVLESKIAGVELWGKFKSLQLSCGESPLKFKKVLNVVFKGTT